MLIRMLETKGAHDRSVDILPNEELHNVYFRSSVAVKMLEHLLAPSELTRVCSSNILRL